MNDLEYVRRSVTLLPDELQVEAVLEAVDAAGDHSTQWRDNITQLLDSATNQLLADVMMIINRIGVKVCDATDECKTFGKDLLLDNLALNEISFS